MFGESITGQMKEEEKQGNYTETGAMETESAG